MSNPLLDDLKDESYKDALASGNLHKKRPTEALPSFERFTSVGYRICLLDETCLHCGKLTRFFSQIMHRETGDQGSIHERALHLGTIHDNPLEPKLPPSISSRNVAYCMNCILQAKGFTL